MLAHCVNSVTVNSVNSALLIKYSLKGETMILFTELYLQVLNIQTGLYRDNCMGCENAFKILISFFLSLKQKQA